MGYCFVIQPFDRGPFDKRYEDVFAPAIVSARLEPYRVDRDPSVSVPINDIEQGIRGADVCLVDITTNNPNVWFELGFALASQKEVVLVCSEERSSPYPFDIQHRSIIIYSTDSPRDFADLQMKVTRRLEAVQAKEARLGQVASISPVATVEGLSQHEIVGLVAIAQNADTPNEGVPVYTVKTDMEKAGFTRVAATLALAALTKKRLAEIREMYGDRGEPYVGYALTEEGLAWLQSNQDKLVLQKEENFPF